MSDNPTAAEALSTRGPWLDRRTFLKLAIGGGVAAIGVGAALRHGGAGAAPGDAPVQAVLAGTDGWYAMPESMRHTPPIWPDPLAPEGQNVYTYGFREVTGFPYEVITQLKGQTQNSSPILYRGRQGNVWKDFTVDDDIRITLHNLGWTGRPDLVDGHTIHWHGFPNQISYFDGVPETSLSVPIGRSFEYQFIPRQPGTYMYHCHFEDVEHVQMGMQGVVFVRPKENPNWAYASAETAFDREFAWMISEVDFESHFLLAHIQQPDWTDYRADAFTINGRSYPDTLADPTPIYDFPLDPPGGRLKYQPHSALVSGNSGETVLLRVANLGFQTHKLELAGLAMKVIAQDAKPLVAGREDYLTGLPRADISYESNTINVPPGRSFDVLITLPEVSAITDFPFFDRNIATNGGADGAGAMRSAVRVYPNGLAPQSAPNL